jgi:hypothetical protein
VVGVKTPVGEDQLARDVLPDNDGPDPERGLVAEVMVRLEGEGLSDEAEGAKGVEAEEEGFVEGEILARFLFVRDLEGGEGAEIAQKKGAVRDDRS